MPDLTIAAIFGLSETLGRRLSNVGRYARLSHIGNEAVGIFFVFGCIRIFNEAAHVFMRLATSSPLRLPFFAGESFFELLLLALLGLAFSAAEP